MKRIFASLIALSLLTGCAPEFRERISAFTSIQNPISNNDFQWAKLSYASLALAVANYRELPLCKKSNPFQLSNICAKRSILVKLQEYDIKAYDALMTAENYIQSNQTLNLASVISAARLAVSTYKDYAASKGIQS